jgi:hypothetical protein
MVLTKFELSTALPIIATFVAIGFALPAIFFSALLDRILFLGIGAGVWGLILFSRHKSYKPVLALYFVVGLRMFFRMFVR